MVLNPLRLRKRLLLPAAFAAASLLVACADDEEDPADGAEATETPTATVTQAPTEAETPTETATETATPTETADDAASIIDVTGVDYAFEGLPESVPAGTQIAFTNASEAEVHEIVAIRLPDEEEASVEELLQLSEEELFERVPGEPAFVLIAPPGADGFPAVGDGTLDEPGRYALICSIPIGADPEAFMAAAEESGEEQPVVEGGPPHFTEGMYAELTVE